MILPTNISIWLKIAGALCTALGSFLLAFRIKEIVKWVVYCIVAHEQSIEQIKRVINGQRQIEPLVEGVAVHLLKIQDKLGIVLLISGFFLLAVGMISTALSYFL